MGAAGLEGRARLRNEGLVNQVAVGNTSWAEVGKLAERSQLQLQGRLK